MSGTDRSRVERVVRYMARPAVSLERLSRRKDGLYGYELWTPWRDGTTAVVFSPLELIEKLAALVPPKGMHLVRSPRRPARLQGVFEIYPTRRNACIEVAQGGRVA